MCQVLSHFNDNEIETIKKFWSLTVAHSQEATQEAIEVTIFPPYPYHVQSMYLLILIIIINNHIIDIIIAYLY